MFHVPQERVEEGTDAEVVRFVSEKEQFCLLISQGG